MIRTDEGERIRVPDTWQYAGRPPGGRTFELSQALDALPSAISDDLTFKKVKNLMRSADSGDLATSLQLYEEIEERDTHLQGVANTRRMALTGLEWEVVSEAESQRFSGDKGLADAAAAYVEEVLGKLESFEEGLEHLAGAIGPNLAVLELVWEGTQLVEIVPIPSHRLLVNPNDVGHLRIETPEHREGLTLRPPKWVIHIPKAKFAGKWTRSISHAVAFIYLIKLLAVNDWAQFVGRFGIPFLWAKMHKNTNDDERRKVEEMLASFGTAGWGWFSESVEMNVLESTQRGTSPHEAIANWCKREMSIAFLGQTLTTDTTGATGTYAAGAVHENVRQDLLEDDVRKEGRTVRRDIIKPLCLYKFPGREVSYPRFRRVFREPIDRKQEVDVMSAFQQAGGLIPKAWAHERVGIPEREGDEEVLEASLDVYAQGMKEGGREEGAER